MALRTKEYYIYIKNLSLFCLHQATFFVVIVIFKVFFREKIRELWCFDVKKVWRQCPSKYSAQWLLKSNHIPKVHRMTRLSDVILDLQLQGVGANHHATLIKSMARQFTKK